MFKYLRDKINFWKSKQVQDWKDKVYPFCSWIKREAAYERCATNKQMSDAYLRILYLKKLRSEVYEAQHAHKIEDITNGCYLCKGV